MPCVQPIFANSLDVSHQVLYLVHLTSSNTSATTGSTPLDVVLRLAFERTAVVRMDLAVVCGLVHTDATFIYSVKRETSGTYQVGVTGGQVNTYMDYSTFHIIGFVCTIHVSDWVAMGGPKQNNCTANVRCTQNPITVMCLLHNPHATSATHLNSHVVLPLIPLQNQPYDCDKMNLRNHGLAFGKPQHQGDKLNYHKIPMLE